MSGDFQNIGPLNDLGYLRIVYAFLYAAQGELADLSPRISHVLTAIEKELEPPCPVCSGSNFCPLSKNYGGRQ